MRAIWGAAAAAIVATQLSGCFFFFIPGSVIGAASDAITGSAGSNCVSSTAKVGDRVRMSDGVTIKQIKSLSGTSTRCQDSNLPIRAELIDVAPVPANLAVAAVTFSVPAGWVQPTAPPNIAATNPKIFESRPDSKAYAAGYVSNRDLIVDARAYVESRRSAQAATLKTPKIGEIRVAPYGGSEIYRYEVTGEAKNGRQIAYFTTIIIGSQTVVVINNWSDASDLDVYRAEFETMPSYVANNT